jgi:hypothetical protein
MSQVQRISRNNTTVTANAVSTEITLYNTVVVSFDLETITLNTGGYFTATTKTRMMQASNQFSLGFAVYQKQGNWFVKYNGEIMPFVGNSITFKR